MKLTILLLMLICLNGKILSQNPNHSIYAEVNGYHVIIHEDYAFRNCAFSPDFQNVVLDGSNLFWYQVDTALDWPYCKCLFNYSVEIDSINAGNYTAFLYAVYEGDTIYQGFTEFAVTGNVICDNELVLSPYASLCVTPVEDISPENMILTYEDHNLNILLKSNKRISGVRIIDLSGQIVYDNKQQAEGEIRLNVSNLIYGLYVVSVFTDSGQYSKKLIIPEN